MDHISDGGPNNNSVASAAFDDILTHCLTGEALDLFRSPGDEFVGKGFAKLKKLRNSYADKSDLSVALRIFTFFEGFA